MNTSIKIVILGASDVGKTAFVRRFVMDKFCTDCSSSYGINIYNKEVRLNNESIMLFIWDLEGSLHFDSCPDSYMIGAEVFIYIFDLTHREISEQLEEQIGLYRASFSDRPIKIIGNKRDLITTEMLEGIRSKLKGIDFTVSSAKTGENVKETFLSIAKLFAH